MSNCGKKKKNPRLSSVTFAQKNDNTVEARAAEILKYILKYYFSMENSNNKSNKKAIMEVLCGESHSEQINIYVTSIRFGGGTDAMIFNYKTAICSISFLCFTEHLFGGVRNRLHRLCFFLAQVLLFPARWHQRPWDTWFSGGCLFVTPGSTWRLSFPAFAEW